MTKVQTLIKEMDDLSINDLELILNNILQKMDKAQKAKSTLDNFIRVGKGIWGLDAQTHINTLRSEDRF